MPINPRDPILALALRASDFTEALNQQPLRVTGLTGTRYQLRIDDAPAGSFTKEQLEAGVNLATLDTPMARQAADVHALTLKHNNIHFTRWRQLQTGLEKESPAHLKEAMDALDAVEAELITAQRAAAQPKTHRYVLAAE
jgi:hypothetical protein